MSNSNDYSNDFSGASHEEYDENDQRNSRLSKQNKKDHDLGSWTRVVAMRASDLHNTRISSVEEDLMNLKDGEYSNLIETDLNWKLLNQEGES